jgi:hypothetical protein
LSVDIGGKSIIVAYHEAFDSVGMYINKTGNPISQITFGGMSKGGQLERLETMKSEDYWVVWQNFFPQADVNRIDIANGNDVKLTSTSRTNLFQSRQI